ncbi:MAG: hypothetical protein IJ781_09660 [Atopobiaceae bacterium]|nr:hypothetical protein [Atopobiaceae bacterium]
MKRARLTVVATLLVALLLSGCGQIARGEESSSADAESQVADLYPFVDFPSGTGTSKTKTAGSGEVTQATADAELFHAKFEGSDVSGSGGIVGGHYHFIATKTDGESWHVKLESNYPTVAGRDYYVTYRFQSDVSGTVKFGDFQEFQIQQGENTVTGVFTAKDSTSYLDLQLGMLPAFTIDFSEIEVKEYADEVDFENALPKPVNFERESRVYERHDQGYDTVLVRRSHAINVNYETIPTDMTTDMSSTSRRAARARRWPSRRRPQTRTIEASGRPSSTQQPAYRSSPTRATASSLTWTPRAIRLTTRCALTAIPRMPTARSTGAA